MMKRILSFTVVICMVIVLLAPVTFAAEQNENWGAIKPQFSYESFAYEIRTPEELQYVSISGETEKYILCNDINLAGKQWRSGPFYGTLDGQGHTISGVNSDNNCLFSYANWGSNVKTTISNLVLNVSGAHSALSIVDINQKNMTITDCKTTGSISINLESVEPEWGMTYSLQCGPISKENEGIIESCNNFVNISISCNKPHREDDRHGQIDVEVGGIVAINNGSVKNCNNYGSITVQTAYITDSDSGLYSCLDHICVGGITAKMSSENSIISGCSNLGELCASKVSSYGLVVGGIMAEYTHDAGLVKVSECTNKGKIDASGNMADVGGIVGTYGGYSEKKPSVIIEKCTNAADISSIYNPDKMVTGYVAGILASSTDECNVSVTSCTNEGNILGGNSAAGIAGSLGKNAQIEDCKNKGNILGDYSAAGIIEYNQGQVLSSINFATVSASEEEVGDSSGIASANAEGGTILDCGNCGLIVNGYGDAAGITSQNRGTIRNSYSTGTIQSNSGGYSELSGIASYNGENGTILNCFAKGTLISASASHNGILAGICATNLGAVSDCFFQGTLSSQSSQSSIVAIGKMFANQTASFNACYGVVTVVVPVGNEDIFALRNFSDANTALACYSNVSGPEWGEAATSMTFPEMQNPTLSTALDTLAGQTSARGLWMQGRPYPELVGLEAVYTQPAIDSSAFDDYYSKLEQRTIRVLLQDISYITNGPTVTATIDNISGAFYGEWKSTASDIEVKIPADYAGDITISCEGYLDKILPAEIIGNFNTIKLWKPAENGLSELQSVLLDKTKNGYNSFADLTSGVATLPVYEGSTDTYSMYVDVDWNASDIQTIKLMQGAKEIALLNEGWNRNLMLGQLLKHAGGVVYIRMGDKPTDKSIGIKVYEAKPVNVSIETGDMQEAIMPEDIDAVGGQKLKLDLKELSDKIIPMNLEVSDDGTVKGTIGLALDQPGGIGHSNWAFGTIKDAIKSWENQTPSDVEVDSLIKELNKYGVPHKSTTQFGITADAQILGYCEGKIDAATGQLQFKECGIITSVGGKVSYTQQVTLPVIPIPVYFEAGMKIKASLTMPMEMVDNHLTAQDESFKVKITIYGGAGVGIPKVLTGGVRGDGELAIGSSFPYDANNAKWELSASGYFVGCILGFDGEWQVWESPSLLIYRDGEWFPGAEVAKLLSVSKDDLSLASRKYLENSTEFFANNPISLYGLNSTTPLTPMKSNVYTYTVPQIVTFSDNSQLLVWVDDAGTETRPLSSNRSALFFSYYDGNVWSEPALVSEDDGTADYNPVLKCLNGTAYLVWNDSDIPFESDEVTLTEVSLAMGISYAQFDQKNQHFTNKSSLAATDDGADFLPEITLVNGAPTVVWANNSVGDYFFSEGTSTLRKAEWLGEGWNAENLSADISNIDSLAAQNTDGSLTIYYSKDKDGDLLSQNDREIFCFTDTGTHQMSNNEVPDSNPSTAGDEVIWYQDGTLCLNGKTITTVEGDDYQLVKNPQGRMAILYSKHTRDASSICAIFNDGAGWGKEVIVAEVQGFIYAYSGTFSSTGLLSVAVTQWDGNGVANLVVYSVLPSCDIGIGYVDYDIYSLVPGKTLSITANIKNIGMLTATALQVSVKNGEEELYNGTLGGCIRPGEETLIHIPCALPVTLPSCLNVEVKPIGAEDYNLRNNSVEYPLRTSDISIEHISATTTEAGTIAIVQLANRGATELTDLSIRASRGSGSGPLLWADTVNLVSPGENVNLSFAIENPLPQGELVYVVIDPIREENIMNNNELFCVVQDLTAPTYILGDVDEDGEITATDALYALQIAVGQGIWTDNQRLAADADADGSVTSTDALFILRASVGQIGLK